MADSVGLSFPTTSIQLGHVFYMTTTQSLWKYIGGPPANASSWVLLNGTFNTQPDVTTWGLAQAGALWYYAPEQMYYGWDGTKVIQLAYAGGEATFNYKTNIKQSDDLLYGSTGSGAIGEIGWSTSSVTTVSVGSEPGHPGIFRFSSSGTNVGRGVLSGTFAAFIGPAFKQVFVIRLNTVDNETTCRFGFINSTSADPPDNFIGFEKTTTDTTWIAVVRENPGDDRQNTNVAVIVDFVTLTAERVLNSGVVKFYINELLVATLSDANIAAMPQLTPCFQIISSNGAATKTFDFDYYQLDMAVER
jgi:hypothetical protein